MKYQVIARKFRPQVFEDVVGQDPIVQTLRNAIEMGRIGHAYLFSGPRGVGKTTMARLLAKALNCFSGPTAAPCNECASCSEIAGGGSIDVLEIDAASNTGVDSIRELRENARYAPSRDRFKIFIIDEVHMLSTSAFNALLKTLEEPPEHIVFIMATTERHKLPATILSRCQPFVFRSIPPTEIHAHLKSIAGREGVGVGDGALEYVVKAAGGSMRDAQSLLDQIIAFGGQDVSDADVRDVLGFVPAELLSDSLTALAQRDAAALFEVVERAADQGLNLQQFVRELLSEVRSLLLSKIGLNDKIAGSPDDRARTEALAVHFSEQDLVRFSDVLIAVENDLRWTSEPRFHLEIACVKLSQIGKLGDIEDVIRELKGVRGEAPRSQGLAQSAPARPGVQRAAATSDAQTQRAAAGPSARERSSSRGKRPSGTGTGEPGPGPTSDASAPATAGRARGSSGAAPPPSPAPPIDERAGATYPAIESEEPEPKRNDPAAADSTPQEGEGMDMTEAARAEPLVQSFLDAYRGEIAHVRSTKTGKLEGRS